jgi:hypothetical protein
MVNLASFPSSLSCMQTPQGLAAFGTKDNTADRGIEPVNDMTVGCPRLMLARFYPGARAILQIVSPRSAILGEQASRLMKD